MEVHPEPSTNNGPFSETSSPPPKETIELIPDAYSLMLYLSLREGKIKSKTKRENKPKKSCC